MNKTLLLLALVGCGDNSAASDAHNPESSGDAAAPTPHAAEVVGDFQSTGILSTLDVPNLRVMQNAVAGVAGSDPFLRLFDGKLYIINRSTGDNITILDAATLALEDQLGTGASSNPQDVAVVGDKLYVPALGTTGVVVLTRGQNATTTIDVATAVGDPDGHPDCVSAYAIDTDVYVACDLLDASFVPRGVGKVAVIDTTTDTVRTTFSLPDKNPQNMFAKTPDGNLLIATVPSFSDYTVGCVARITVGATPTASCLVSNQMLGGFATHMDVQPPAKLWLAVGSYDSSFNAFGALRGYDLGTGSLSPAVSPTSELIVDVAACSDGTLVVADGTMNAAGLRLYANAVETTTVALPVGLPPATGNNLACYDR